MKTFPFLLTVVAGLVTALPASSVQPDDVAPTDKALSVWYLVLANSYKDAPGLSERGLPADSIAVRVSDDTIKTIRARGTQNPDLILAPYYLTAEIQE